MTKFDTEDSVQKPSNFPHAISVEETEKVDYSFVLKEDNFVAGDIVLWDGEKKVVADPNMFSLPTSGYTPIGVIVIPESHTGDGKARMMSTRWMSCEDPENGSPVFEKMVWGNDGDLSGLTNYTQVPVIARYDGESHGGVTALTEPQAIYTTAGYTFLPSNYPGFTGETNPEDEGTRWCQSEAYLVTNETGGTNINSYNYYAPSPYAKDRTPNPLYRATSYSGGSINNALSYFNGRHQTDVILEARGERDYGTWKPTYDTPEDYPAASCCDMYHTVGTSQGDWYLPSIAELGYIIARLGSISNAMSKVNGIRAFLSVWAWSSSVHNSSFARHIYFTNGRVSYYLSKSSGLIPTVAFTSLQIHPFRHLGT